MPAELAAAVKAQKDKQKIKSEWAEDFRNWANPFLKSFIEQVVFHPKFWWRPEVKDNPYYRDVADAFVMMGQRHVDLDHLITLYRMNNFLRCEAFIDHPNLRSLVAPLTLIYNMRVSTMEITSDCPHCKHHYTVMNDPHHGQSAWCFWKDLRKDCQPKKRICSACKTMYFDDPPQFTLEDVEKLMEKPRIKCPNCGVWTYKDKWKLASNSIFPTIKNVICPSCSEVFLSKEILGNGIKVSDVGNLVYSGPTLPKPVKRKQHPLENQDDVEILNVVSMPVAVPSKIGTPLFEQEVRSIFQRCLWRGFTWITSAMLSDRLKVNLRDFEYWADRCEWLEPTVCGATGATYYRLTTKKGKKMKVADIGTPAFEEDVSKILNSGDKPWKSQEYILKELGFEEPASKDEPSEWQNALDVFEAEFALENQNMVRKVGKDRIYWALENRLTGRSQQKQTDTNNTAGNTTDTNNGRTITNTRRQQENKKKNKGKARELKASAHLEEVLAFSMLHSQCDQFIRTMQHYANRLAVRHPDSFAYFTRAEKEMSSGVALLKKNLKIDDQRLPKLEEL